MSDQHNPRVMGCAGDPYVRTPNIDALASRGLTFTNMYCASPLCVPSRMAFMAGRSASSVEIYNNAGMLAPNVPTFARGLSAAGYETVLCGRMHFVGEDQYHGFERRLFGDCHHGEYLTKEILGEGEHHTDGQTKYAVQFSGYGKTGYEAFDATVTERACAILESRREDERPLALVVGCILPHNPLICSRDLFEHYLAAIPEPNRFEEPLDLHPAVRRWRERRRCGDLTPQQMHRGTAAYYGLVETMDRNVGRIVEAVAGSALAENTIVIYCSDHGDLAGEHGMFWKSSFYEGSVRVPFVASWPGRIPEGREVGCVASLIDVGPTLLDMAGAEALSGAEGRSFRAFLEGGDTSRWPNEAFAEYGGAHGDAPSAMLRTGPWKLIYFDETKSCQLFHLEDDPGELVDRAKETACREIVRDGLRKIHSRWSPEKMREGASRATKAHQEINLGSASFPFEYGIGDVEAHNIFDESQLDDVFPDRPKVK
jgi:choline-sulfatase